MLDFLDVRFSGSSRKSPLPENLTSRKSSFQKYFLFLFKNKMIIIIQSVHSYFSKESVVLKDNRALTEEQFLQGLTPLEGKLGASSR